jgi:hypothetical protein
MAFIHEGSCECMKSELDLFSVPPTQTSIESATIVEHHKTSSITGSGPIEFDIKSTGVEYIDLNNTQLYVKVKIVKADGSAIAANAPVGPVNGLLNSLFSQVDVSFNGQKITDSSNNYPYRAYIEDLLSYGPAAKKSQLTAGLFYKDEPGKLDKPNPFAADAADKNSGLVKRAAFTNESKEVDLIGRIHADIFFQHRYILNELPIKIKLTRSTDEFCLMTDGNEKYKVIILDAVIMLRKVKISPSVYLAHAKALENGMAKYPIKRVICKSFTVAAGTRDLKTESLFTGQLPTRLVIGCVDNRAYNGNYAFNPFNFQHYSATSISVYLDGQQHGLIPLALDYANRHYVNAYMNIFSGSGKENQDEGNDIERTEFDKGFTLYVYDLTPDLSESDSFNLTRSGNVRLEMKFADALPHTISIVTFAEFENIIEVDRNRNVVTDFGV